MEILSAAEVAALRTAMGLSSDQLAAMLGVNPRTVRSWESGRDRLSASSSGAVRTLLARHNALVEDYLATDATIHIPRAMDSDAVPPRGWFLAAAGRAMADEPDLMVEWA